MLQPFEPMRPIFVERLIPLKKVYLVSQMYKRGENPTEEIPKIPLLLTDYDDPGLAKIHLNALRGTSMQRSLTLRNQRTSKRS